MTSQRILKSIHDVEIPEMMSKFVIIEKKLFDISEENLKNLQKEIKQLIESEDDYSELITLILSYVESCPSKIKLFGCLVVHLSSSFSNKFTEELLERSRALFNRDLYNRGLFSSDDIRKRIKTYTDLAYFYLPEFGTEILNLKQDNYRFNSVNKCLEMYKKNDWKDYKDFLMYGYQKNSLGYAIKYDDIELLQDLIQTNKDSFKTYLEIGLFEGFGGLLMPVSACAYYGSINAFKFMLKNRVGCVDQSIASFSIKGGNMEIINMCENLGVDYSSMLGECAKYHQYRIFDHLLSEGASKNYTVEICLSNGNLLALLYLIQSKSVPLNIDDALRRSAIYGSCSACQYFIKLGANIHAQTKTGKTILDFASQYDKSSIIKILANSGVDIYQPGFNGLLPILYASKHDSYRCVEAFLKLGVDPEISDENGHTPLFIAATKGAIKTCKVLIENGADPNSRTEFMQTPLIAAVKEGHIEVADYLLKHGAKVSLSSKGFLYPIHYAVNNLEMLKLLVKRGADVNVQNSSGVSPLWWCQNPKCRKFLIKNGATTSTTNNFNPKTEAMMRRQFQEQLDQGNIKPKRKTEQNSPVILPKIPPKHYESDDDVEPITIQIQKQKQGIKKKEEKTKEIYEYGSDDKIEPIEIHSTDSYKSDSGYDDEDDEESIEKQIQKQKEEMRKKEKEKAMKQIPNYNCYVTHENDKEVIVID